MKAWQMYWTQFAQIIHPQREGDAMSDTAEQLTVPVPHCSICGHRHVAILCAEAWKQAAETWMDRALEAEKGLAQAERALGEIARTYTDSDNVEAHRFQRIATEALASPRAATSNE